MNDNRNNPGRGRSGRMPAHPDDERPRERRKEQASAPAPAVKERERPADTIGEDLDPGRFGLITKPTTDIDVARDQLIEAQKLGFNLLGVTAMRIDEIPPDHRLTIRLVRFPIADLDADYRAYLDRASKREDGPRRWDDDHPNTNGVWFLTDDGNPALTRASLDRLGQAAGLRDAPQYCRRVDDGKRPWYWRYAHGVRVKGLDGQYRVIVREKELDLSDEVCVDFKGKPWSAARKARAREHGAQVCQSKAANRAVRAALGVRGSYSWVEARRPFAVPVMMWTPPDDPEVRRMVAAVELGLIGGPGSMATKPAPAGEVIDAEYEGHDDDFGDPDRWEG